MAIWLLETLLASLVLFLLWHPAISIATLRPQQNIVSVLIDDSRSMSIKEDGKTRLEQATAALNGGVLDDLRKRFQVRLYRFGKDAERIEKTDKLTGAAPASRIGDSLKRGAGRHLHTAAGRGGAAERRRGQFRRHRSRYDRADPAAADSCPHHRLRQRESG